MMLQIRVILMEMELVMTVMMIKIMMELEYFKGMITALKKKQEEYNPFTKNVSKTKIIVHK